MGNFEVRSAHLTKDLQQATADLHEVNSWVGLLRFCVIGGVFLSLVGLAWLTPNLWAFMGLTAIAAVFYAFWFICTHDTVHYTLTGWPWFETLMPRLISWPMLWPYGVYAEIHRLHHGWNGSNLQDPERVQWTWDEYHQASPLMRWYVRHQWAIDIFVFAGFGMIYKTFMSALRLQIFTPRLRQQLWADLTGILIVQGILLAVALFYGVLLHYLLFWLVLERVIGVVAQTRDHLEHYALWGKSSNHQLTQLYACRNLKTWPIVGWLMGGLDYHAVHHAFPDIPFNQLPQAFERIQAVLQQHHLPTMKQDRGYLRELLYFISHPFLIGDPNPADPTDRNHRIAM